MATATKLSSEWIYKFYRELDRNGLENHALMIEQGGEIVFEEYLYPYSADMPHTLFSVTKSLVSTAVGFAISEGMFSLDSEILPFFPEYKHCESDEWNSVTVRSLLTMQSNKEFSFTQDMTKDYVGIFMKAPFRKKDRGFLYSNNDVHILAALIQKLSGMSLADYLMPRLFEPLGIEKPQWETDAKGDCIGGTGAYMKLRDLVKICRCYADGGRFAGRQIIPEEWTKEATRIHVPLSGRDNEDGYGYLFWTYKGTFSMNGMYGQIITYFPQYDAVVGMFNATVEDKLANTFMLENIPKAFESASDSEWDSRLSEYFAGRNKKPAVCDDLPDIPTGKTFYLTAASDIPAKIMFPASLIPRSLTSSFAKRPKKNLNCVSFEKTENVLTVKWFEESDEVIVNCGLDGSPRMSECAIKGYKYKIWAYAYTENGTLKAVVKPLNTASTQYLTFAFSDGRVKIKFDCTPSFTEFICKNADESSFVRNSGKLRAPLMKIVRKALLTTEKPLEFKTK